MNSFKKRFVPRLNAVESSPRPCALHICAAFFLTCGAFLITLSSASAQSSLTTEELKKLPPETAARYARTPIAEILNSKLPQGQKRDPDWVNRLPITLHLRGTTGTALPSAESLREQRRRSRQQQTTPEERIRRVVEQRKVAMKRFQASRTMTKLPECHRDTKKFTPFATPFRKDVVQDLLFLQPGETFLETEELFGKQTRLVTYDPAKPSNWAMYGKVMGITCLPTRLRILGRGLSQEEGLSALKNYDTDPYGPGELNQSVASHFNRIFKE